MPAHKYRRSEENTKCMFRVVGSSFIVEFSEMSWGQVHTWLEKVLILTENFLTTKLTLVLLYLKLFHPLQILKNESVAFAVENSPAKTFVSGELKRKQFNCAKIGR